MKAAVIAEAGTAHLGDLGRAKHLATYAAWAGADAIKFQWFSYPTPDTMFCWLKGDEARADRWHKSRMPFDYWRRVKDHCDELGIRLMASCFEDTTVRWQVRLGLPVVKVASRAAGRYPYRLVQDKYKLISDGMIPRHGMIWPSNSVRMQCTAQYPAEVPWMNHPPCMAPTGYSSHSKGPFLAIDALALGCKLVEVHFCCAPMAWAGPDEPVSLTADELKFVCEARDYYDDK